METTRRRRSGRRPRRAALACLLLASTLAAGGWLRGPAEPGGPATETLVLATGPGPVQLRAQLDRNAVLRGGEVRVELVMAAQKAAMRVAPVRRPTDLVVVLDRSGSMQGEKLEQARAAVRALAGRLAANDRFALVTYAQDARLAIALQPATPKARSRWEEALGAVQAQGGTHLAAGLELGVATAEAARAAGREARVILVSDGLANLGDASPEGLRRRAARAVSGEFVVSTVGVGVEFDGALLAGLADAGTGNFHYLESASDLAGIFAAEFETARTTVASALEVRIAPGPGVSVLDAAGYPLERTADGVRFRPGPLFAGQERSVWVALRAPAEGGATQDLVRVALHYRIDGEAHELRLGAPLRVARVDAESDYWAALDPGSWERAVGTDDLGRLQREAASAVAAGRPEEALRNLRSRRQELADANARVGSAPVEGTLRKLEALEEQLSGHASGDAPLAARDLQKLRALGYGVARPGSVKQAPPTTEPDERSSR